MPGRPGTDRWRWDLPVEQAVLVRRYKRFLADVRFPDGQVETVHCPNSGSMKGMKEPGSPVVVSDSNNPKRRLQKTLELVQVDDGAGRTWVGVNTMRPNRWVQQAIAQAWVPGIPKGSVVRPEVPLDGSRLDFLIEAPDGARVWLEVKNTTLAFGGTDRVEAGFPDAVTTRGLRHLRLLEDRVTKGERGVVLFLVNRGDAGRFRAAGEIDPDYAEGLGEACAAGVEAVPLQVRHHVRRMPQGTRVSSRWLGTLPVLPSGIRVEARV